MDKKQILVILDQAKPDHMKWVKQANKLLDSLPQNQIEKPVACTDCLFGKWHDSEGYRLINIPELEALEILHREIHNIYTAIYYITFDRRKQARTTIITNAGETPVDERKFRDKKLKQLEKKSVKFVQLLTRIEKKVASMSNQDFDSPWLS